MKVSFYCVTESRPKLLERAIADFKAQDWSDEKEMIIVNKSRNQKLIWHDKLDKEIKIYNDLTKTRNLGEAHNIAASLCTGDIIFPTDDDDRYASYRIKDAVAGLSKEGIYKSGFILLDSNPMLLTRGILHCNRAFTKDVLLSNGGYTTNVRSNWHDIPMQHSIDWRMASGFYGHCTESSRPSYIYSFYTNPYHDSTGNPIPPNVEEGDIILNSVDSIDFKALNYNEAPKLVFHYTKPRERCYKKRYATYRVFSAGIDRKELCY